MKRLIPLFVIVLAWLSGSAQNQVDALRYSQTYAGGTARSTAMAGAFGALGGDCSSISQNPAGLGVYRSSEITFTSELLYNNTFSRYYGNEESDNKYNFNINNLGFVFANSKGDDGLAGIAFSVGYNRVNNFHSNTLIAGHNTRTSLGDVYVESANYGDGDEPVSIDYLLPFSEWLFYDSWVMDQDSAGYYFLNSEMVEEDGSVNLWQQNTIERSGKIDEWLFSAAFNIGHFLYIGGTFGVLPLKYDETSVFSEFDNANRTEEYFSYYEWLHTEWFGYTGKFGIILKPIPQLRIGAAYHLPAYYYLTDTYNASMQSAFVPEVVYPVDEYGNYIENAEFDYRIITPAKYVGSLGLTLAKFLILSTDIEYIDYASMELVEEGDEYNFSGENQTINDIYRGNINLKSGAEVRIDNFYLRGGFGFYGSAYKENEENADANNYWYSGGFGFRNKKAFIDFALVYMAGSERYVVYDMQSLPASTSELDVNTIRSLVTLGVKF
jgi:hypothetical protein